MGKTKVEKHFDEVAVGYDPGKTKYSYYYESLKRLLGSLIPKNKKVFEVGCGTGDLIVSLGISEGYAMDLSRRMVEIARVKHKHSKNIVFSTIWPTGEFEYIFMSDVIEHLEKPQETFERVSKLMNKSSKFIITMANPIWEPLLMIWEKLGLKMKEGPHKRIGSGEIEELCRKSGTKILKHDYKLLVPIKIPLITNFANKYLEKYIRRLAFIEYFVIVKS